MGVAYYSEMAAGYKVPPANFKLTGAFLFILHT